MKYILIIVLFYFYTSRCHAQTFKFENNDIKVEVGFNTLNSDSLDVICRILNKSNSRIWLLKHPELLYNVLATNSLIYIEIGFSESSIMDIPVEIFSIKNKEEIELNKIIVAKSINGAHIEINYLQDEYVSTQEQAYQIGLLHYFKNMQYATVYCSFIK